ncbi:hypothetical protein [Bacillus phage Anath]|uniref:Uncharacterized protein n=1 Tax=Bacillus phage Anath TaxID=2108114 RepID=A0A2P1JUJ0_9CAUD|nr:hypothetical protein [Bacillus phage Anath]
MKVKTLIEHCNEYGSPAGTIVEVSEETGNHWVNLGVAEEVKPARKAPAKKDK